MSWDLNQGCLNPKADAPHAAPLRPTLLTPPGPTGAAQAEDPGMDSVGE